MTSVGRIYFLVLSTLLFSGVTWVTHLYPHAANLTNIVREGNQGERYHGVSLLSGLKIQQERFNVFSEENEIEGEKLNHPLTYIASGVCQESASVHLFKIFSYTFKRIPILREHWFYTSTRRHIALRTLVV